MSRKSKTKFSQLNQPPSTTSSGMKAETPASLIEVKLKRRMNLIHGIAVIFGMAVGGGVFITPQNVLQHASSIGLTLVLWLLGGVLSLLGALTYAEIGVTYPVAGEKYAYLDILYGPYIAFTFMWQYLLIMRPGGNAIKAVMCARYLLKPIFPECKVPELAIKLFATLFVAIITFLNCRTVKGSLRSQSLMTASTIISLSLLAGVGVLYMIWGLTDETLNDPFSNSERNSSRLIHAFHSTIFSYSGWSALNFLVEELNNPQRNLPISIIISLILITILYVLVNLAYIAVLGKDGVLQSEAVAISVTLKVFGAPGWLMSIMIAITAFSSYNSGLLVGSRLAYIGSRKGHLPKIFSLLSINHLSPVVSIIFQSLLSLIYVWLVDVFGIINNLVLCSLISDFLVVIGFIRVRYKQSIKSMEPDDKEDGGTIDTHDFKMDAKLKMPLLIHVSYCFMVAFLISVSLSSNPESFASGLVIVMIVSTAYYVLIVRSRWNPFSKINMFGSMGNFVQKLLLCTEEDTSSK